MAAGCRANKTTFFFDAKSDTSDFAPENGSQIAKMKSNTVSVLETYCHNLT